MGNGGSAGMVASAPHRGLSEADAAAQRARDGSNELSQEQRRGVMWIARDALREPMLQLLIAAGALYLLIGDRAEALILLAFALLNLVLVVIQDGRTERAVAALKQLTSLQCRVIRDGSCRRLPASDLVTGDIIAVAEGDRVPADAILLEVETLEVDESLLTGESMSVDKRVSATPATDARPGGSGGSLLWSGSLVIRGHGIARVTATGPRTEIGRIGASLGTVEAAPTPLHVQTRRLVRLFAGFGIGSSVLLAVVYGALHGDWIKATLAGITLAMATLPEEFPLVLTIFLVMGAWRISGKKVLARRAAAIEALGAATVLCTDKTGTLTENRMTVAALVAGDTRYPVVPGADDALPGALHGLLEFAILASRTDAVDPMEKAFHELGQRYLKDTEHLHSQWTLEHGYALSPEMLAMSQVWQATSGTGFVVAAKGAPESVIDLCHLDPGRRAEIREEIDALAAQGLRVLAVAKASFPGPGWPTNQHDFEFAFVGLIGLADPLRPGVVEAVAACKTAGIRVAMITGDHPVTARAIAAAAGIPSDGVMTGTELGSLDDAALRERLRGTAIFARIMPEEKLRLVQAYQAAGEVVVMTGDGVNDAPSLKAAHIGVAMGGRGTDVAREAASLILLDDAFPSLVTAIRLGRRIDDNLRKAFGYILAVHFPIAGMSLLPVLLGWPLLLGPVHVVFLELIIDPGSSIMFEAEREEDDVMARPPRIPGAPLFDRGLVIQGLVQGLIVLAAALAVFLAGIYDVHGEQVARGMAFVTLVLGNLGLVLTNRTRGRLQPSALLRPNPAFGLVIAVTLVALFLAFAVPYLRGMFEFVPLAPGQFAVAGGAALASVAVNLSLVALLRRIAAR